MFKNALPFQQEITRLYRKEKEKQNKPILQVILRQCCWEEKARFSQDVDCLHSKHGEKHILAKHVIFWLMLKVSSKLLNCLFCFSEQGE